MEEEEPDFIAGQEVVNMALFGFRLQDGKSCFLGPFCLLAESGLFLLFLLETEAEEFSFRLTFGNFALIPDVGCRSDPIEEL